MNKSIKIVLITLLFSFTVLYAEHTHHNNCNHQELSGAISSEAVQKIAIDEVKRLAQHKKIAKSWKSVPVFQVGRTHYGDNDDWIVVFENSKIKKKSRKKLYIFVSKLGQIRGANYTGM